jgi:DNA polymerase III alpha subunit
MTDIDIDVPCRDTVLAAFKHVPAAMQHKGRTKKHASGVYFHKVPVDPFTGLCTVEYKQAEDIGFFKLDILNVHVYQGVKDEAHLIQLMNQTPTWELLEHKEFCDGLFQLHGHHSVCAIMKPKTVEQLAAVLAMIRPAKRYLIGKSWDTVFSEVWNPVATGEYSWKKSHAFSYAFAVMVQINLICEGLV